MLIFVKCIMLDESKAFNRKFVGRYPMNLSYSTAQKMKFSIKDLFSKCDLIGSFPRIWSHLLKKSLMENFIFCAVFQFFHILVIILIKEQFTLWITKFHIQWQYFPTLNLVYLYLLHVFMRTIFCLSLNFLQKVLQIRLVFPSYFFYFYLLIFFNCLFS